MFFWKDLEEKARGKKFIVSVAAINSSSFEALKNAKDKGIVEKVIATAIGEVDFEVPSWIEIIKVEDEKQAAKIAVSKVRNKEAGAIMKGKVQTSTFMKAILDKEEGLRTGRLLSHILAVEHTEKGIMFITDGGINIEPTLEEKAQIIENAVESWLKIEDNMPKVAVVAAVETVNPKMNATLEAASLTQMAIRRQIKAIVDGPLALDNAVSKEAALHKKITSFVAGEANIIIVPDIEAGNILGKACIYLAGMKAGGIVAGASAPIIMLSRADTEVEKYNSIVLAAAIS